jgi:hypothetical protein
LTGEKYGRLLVLKLERIEERSQKYYQCRCDCGKAIVTRGDRLIAGTTKSCGCLQREITKELYKTSLIAHIKHNDSHHSPHGKTAILYRKWGSMIMRCYNPNNSGYKRYGARGIIVCDEWRHDYSAFKRWALKTGYRDNAGLSIDRIDNNGNYAPENCRWANAKEQGRNKSINHLITIDGETKCISEWAEIYKIKVNTLGERLRRGWSEIKAIKTPLLHT